MNGFRCAGCGAQVSGSYKLWKGRCEVCRAQDGRELAQAYRKRWACYELGDVEREHYWMRRANELAARLD